MGPVRLTFFLYLPEQCVDLHKTVANVMRNFSFIAADDVIMTSFSYKFQFLMGNSIPTLFPLPCTPLYSNTFS